MTASRRNLQLASGLLVGAGYLALSYFVTNADHPPLLAVWVTLMPIASMALVAAWRARMRWLWLACCAVAAGWVVLHSARFSTHVAWLYFAQHAGAMTLLGFVFGSTLGGQPEQALCSRIAMGLVAEPLDAAYLRYTRNVTLAWTVFFAVSAGVSVVLFVAAPLVVWSTFADVGTPVLLGVMFVAEYLVRRSVLPDRPALDVLAIIHGWRDFSRRQESTR
ncbi:MAG: hypothetical protein M0T86_06565 [Betaproteobacteria bacterium]|nr:hypothetical protein [Betaproteobacteria bacterium]